MNWLLRIDPHYLQIFALACGLAALALIFWRDRKEDEKKGKWLTRCAALLNALVPVVLMFSVSTESHQSNALEAKRDEVYSNLIKQFTREAKEREANFSNLLNAVTGGNSFPFVEMSFHPHAMNRHTEWQVRNCGTNALQDVNLSIVNLTQLFDDFDILSKRTIDQQPFVDKATTFFQIGGIPPEAVKQFEYPCTVNRTGNLWSVRISARNGTWNQEIRVYSVSNSWMQTNSGLPRYWEYHEKRQNELKARLSP